MALTIEAAELAGRRGRLHEQAVSQHRHVSAMREHLLEEVRDVDDRRSTVAEFAGRSRAAARASSPVSAAVGSSMTISLARARERPQDLDLLLLRDPECPHRHRPGEMSNCAFVFSSS